MFILLFILAILTIFIILSYNSLIYKRNQVDNIFSTVDVLLQRRYDLIPNLVETVKGYTRHEKDIVEELAVLRANAVNGYLSNDEKVGVDNKISQKLSTVVSICESYPELKSSEHFLRLQAALNETEEQISAARRAYNASVTDFNNAIQTIPTNIIASYCGFTPRNLFETNF